MLVFLLVFLYVVSVAVIGLTIVHFDRVIATVLRRLNIRVFPEAVGIALLIIDRPEEWNASQYTLSHKTVGSIWTGNQAFGIKIETDVGVWHPNRIERRIIRDAVDWRINTYVRNRIAVALQAPRAAVSAPQ